MKSEIFQCLGFIIFRSTSVTLFWFFNVWGHFSGAWTFYAKTLQTSKQMEDMPQHSQQKILQNVNKRKSQGYIAPQNKLFGISWKVSKKAILSANLSIRMAPFLRKSHHECMAERDLKCLFISLLWQADRGYAQKWSTPWSSQMQLQQKSQPRPYFGATFFLIKLPVWEDL